jgi:hypothetical protein
MENWHKGDNGILFLSHAYKLQLGCGWDIPAGILHARQPVHLRAAVGSDIAAMFQSLVE